MYRLIRWTCGWVAVSPRRPRRCARDRGRRAAADGGRGGPPQRPRRRPAAAVPAGGRSLRCRRPRRCRPRRRRAPPRSHVRMGAGRTRRARRASGARDGPPLPVGAAMQGRAVCCTLGGPRRPPRPAVLTVCGGETPRVSPPNAGVFARRPPPTVVGLARRRHRPRRGSLCRRTWRGPHPPRRLRSRREKKTNRLRGIGGWGRCRQVPSARGVADRSPARRAGADRPCTAPPDRGAGMPPAAACAPGAPSAAPRVAASLPATGCPAIAVAPTAASPCASAVGRHDRRPRRSGRTGHRRALPCRDRPWRACRRQSTPGTKRGSPPLCVCNDYCRHWPMRRWPWRAARAVARGVGRACRSAAACRRPRWGGHGPAGYASPRQRTGSRRPSPPASWGGGMTDARAATGEWYLVCTLMKPCSSSTSSCRGGDSETLGAGWRAPSCKSETAFLTEQIKDQAVTRTLYQSIRMSH